MNTPKKHKPQPIVLFNLRRHVILNGYKTRTSIYYSYSNARFKMHGTVSANDRNTAKRAIRNIYPNAEFYR